MGRIERFEDLIAWQKARTLAAAIYQASRQFPRDFALVTQIRKSAISVASNIAEGFERNRPSEFHQFLSIAKSSCGELRTQLYIAHDAGYLTSAEADALQSLAAEVGRIVGGLRAAIERRHLRHRRTQHSALSTQL